MRRLFSLFALTCVFSGCGDTASLINGPSPAFLVEDTFERSQLQDHYFRLVCSGAETENGACPPQPSEEWRDVIYIALNDIDDRCEIYVSSLRQAKKEGDAFVSKLVTTGAATTAILSAVLDKKSASDAKAIAIVQAAFGLSQQALSTYYSRFLLAVPYGAVQQLLLKRQTAFRVALRDGVKVDGQVRKMRVTSKADAYYVIRSYLRICLPATIEASINEGLEDLNFLIAEEDVSAPSRYLSGLVAGAPYAPSRQRNQPRRRVDPDIEALTARE